ncbi:ABC transporter permease [Tenggerimyces flavus]|uniref:ABC transporter permease n=1 Tax=Tenggerimyces flavus TaxID=1708749 RepID=A0ABV7YEX8_9ACTN|nr:ABC transporter permease [Tenggerimyces flavus]MBM7786853.1 peptide/nickel transport system permease protein [Tenggerimyces flavus]
MTDSVVVVEPTATRPLRGRRVLRRLVRNPLAVAGFVVLAIATLAAVFAPLLTSHEPDQTHFDLVFAPPGSAEYILGTDNLGRDVFSRILFGLQSSLQASVLAVLVALAIGVPLGLAAGYSPLLDALISRVTDLVLAFPFLILAVGLAAIRGPSLTNAALAIGIAQIPGMIRIVRSETLRLKALDFVAAAIVSSASDAWVLVRHILPNAMSAIIVQATIAIPVAILGEAVLSFLGLGIRPPQPSLGTMLADAQQDAARAPWTAVIPGLAIMLVALAFNLFGDGLRDALDPKSSRR